MSKWKNMRFLGYGILIGTAGVKLLSGKTAKKAYTCLTAAVLRGVDEVTKTATKVKENCDDIYFDAKAMNEAAENEDAWEETAEEKPSEEVPEEERNDEVTLG